jgi:hypothetical protein
MHGGRTLVARTIDFIMFRAFLLFIIFIIVLYLSLSTTVSLLISIFITAAISLSAMAYNKAKVEKYITKDMLRIKQKCLLEKLTFLKNNEYAEYVNRLFDGKIEDVVFTDDGFCAKYNNAVLYAFHNHPSSKCTVADVLKVYRLSGDADVLIILSLSEFADDAERLLSSLPEKVEIVSGEDVLEIAKQKGMLPDESEAEENAIKEMNETIVTFEKLKESAFSSTKIKGYIICGIVIMCWPLVTGFRIYYPIIAIFCFALAIITYKKSKSHKESSDVNVS